MSLGLNRLNLVIFDIVIWLLELSAFVQISLKLFKMLKELAGSHVYLSKPTIYGLIPLPLLREESHVS